MTTRPWYDNINEIRVHCKTLEGFHTLLQARYKARKETNCRLEEFVVNGLWRLDQFGQVARISKIYDEKYNLIDLSKLPPFPRVVYAEQFKTEVQRRLIPEISYEYGMGGWDSSPVPPIVACVECGQKWSMDDIPTALHQQAVIKEHQDATDLLGDFSMWSAQEITNKLRELLSADIDLIVEKESPLDCHVKIDYYRYNQYIHRACLEKQLAATTRNEFTKAFVQSDLEFYGLIRTKNEYGSESYRGPWYTVDTALGTVTVGWRKSVIHVDYSNISSTYTSDTNETKAAGMEHVNNYEELTQALNKLVAFLKEST